MENASKALLMAGAVLIALMVIGMFILMFNSISDYQTSNLQDEKEQQITEFNKGYIGYTRDNVRGTELLSLLNKVIDYNERKAEIVGTTGNEGQAVAFKPMTVKVKISDPDKLLSGPNQEKKYFTKNTTYTVSTNTQDNQLQTILSNTKSIENKYGRDGIQKLVSNTTAIFLTNPQDWEKEEALKKYNSIVTNANKETSYSNLLKNHKDNIYRYYEFTQFKRAYFKCTATNYDKNTGRILEMDFEFTGKLN